MIQNYYNLFLITLEKSRIAIFGNSNSFFVSIVCFELVKVARIRVVEM